jgi:hypothetical protein
MFLFRAASHRKHENYKHSPPHTLHDRITISRRDGLYTHPLLNSRSIVVGSNALRVSEPAPVLATSITRRLPNFLPQSRRRVNFPSLIYTDGIFLYQITL